MAIHALAFHQRRRQVVEFERLLAAQSYSALDGVFQFANVAGPVILDHAFHRRGSNVDHLAGRGPVEEVMHQRGNIGSPLAQRRQMQGHNVQAEVKVFAERTLFVGGLQVAVGGGDHPDIDFVLMVAAHRPHLFFLQHAQQLGLHLQRQLPNFIQKDRASAGRLKEALFGPDGAGKSALLVAEQFALDQGRHQRPAIHGHKRTLGKLTSHRI